MFLISQIAGQLLDVDVDQVAGRGVLVAVLGPRGGLDPGAVAGSVHFNRGQP